MDKKRTIKDNLATVGRQSAQGLTFSVADELADPLGAAMAKAILGDKADYADLLKQARAQSKADLGRDWEEAPALSLVSNIAGSVPFGFTKTAGALANWASNAGRIGRTARGAAVGAGYGALAGLGSGDDNLQDRAAGLATGGVLGGVLGGAGGLLSKRLDPNQLTIQKALKKGKKLTTSKAEKFLMEDLAQRPDIQDVLKRAETLSQQSKKSGIPLTLPELVAQSSNDPLLTKQALLKNSPMTAGRVDEFYTARTGTPTQAGSIENALMREAQSTGGGAGSYDEVAQALINRAKKATSEITGGLVAKAQPLYEQAFGKKVNPNELKALLAQDPVAADYLQKALKANDPSLLKQVQGQSLNSIATIDAAKKLMDKTLSGYGADAPANPRAINEAKNALLSLADKYAPNYGLARNIYSGNPDALAMRSQIGSLADIDPMQAQNVVKNLFSGTQQNAEMAAQALGDDAQKAVAARIYNAMDTLRNPTDPVTGQVTQLANRIAPDARTLDMLKAYGAPQSLQDALSVINQAKISDRLSSGSPTAQLMSAEKGMEQAANAGMDILTGNKIGLVRKVANMLGRNDPVQDPQFMKDMADLMLTDKGIDLLRRAAMGQKNAVQEVSKLTTPTLINKATTSATSPRTLSNVTMGAISNLGQGQNTEQAPTAKPNTFDFSQDMDLLTPNPAQMPDFSQDMDLLQPQTNKNDLFERIKAKESGGNPNAQAKTSSASGLYQFTDATWNDMVNKYGEKYGITVDMKNDPQAQEIMVRQLAADNSRILEKQTGQPVDDGRVYLAHFMGAPAAAKLINNLGTGVSAAQMFPSAATANKNIFFDKSGQPRTVEQVYNIVTSKVRGA